MSGSGRAGNTLFSGAARFVTANYFQVLGVRPPAGTGLPENTPDHGGELPLVAVISHALWEQRLDLAPDIIGRSLKVNGTSVTIVGVAPLRFAGARTGGSQLRVWLPLSTRPLLLRTNTDLTSDGPAFLGLAARLQPGIEPDQALPTVDAIGARTMQLTTGSQPAGRRSTDVVPMLAGNYFPPSGEAPNAAIDPILALRVE